MPLFIRTCGIYGLAALAPGFDEVIRVMPDPEHVHDRPSLAIPVTTVEVSDLDDWGEDELAAIVRDHPEQIVPGPEHVTAILDAGAGRWPTPLAGCSCTAPRACRAAWPPRWRSWRSRTGRAENGRAPNACGRPAATASRCRTCGWFVSRTRRSTGAATSSTPC